MNLYFIWADETQLTQIAFLGPDVCDAYIVSKTGRSVALGNIYYLAALSNVIF